MSMGTAEARYRSLETYRQSFLDRARDCSELTIPHLYRPTFIQHHLICISLFKVSAHVV